MTAPPLETGRSWWAAGLNLPERLAGAPEWPTGASETVRARLDRWRSAHGLGATGQWEARLADAGITEARLLALLAEPATALAGRTAKPAWARLVEQVVAAAPERPEVSAAPAGPDAFAVPLRPFVELACGRLGSRATGTVPRDVIDLDAVCRGFASALGARLAGLAARTAVFELNLAREAGRLAGATAADRFADFLAQLGARGGLAAMFARYPVLGRLLAQACEQAVEAMMELLTRFAADRSAIVTELLGGVDPGRLVAVDTDRGDRHQRGRSVAILRFATGAPVVYKPRSLALHAHFAELGTWLNGKVPGLGLGAVAAVVRSGYGWLEFVSHRPCADLAGIARFYRRQGALLALLYAVDGTDIHFQNLIACADTPMLVDVETLFHPTLPVAMLAGPDPAVAALAASVQRVAVLPQLLLGEHGALDISGLGGDKGGVFPTDAVDWDAAGTDRMRLVRRSAEFSGGTNRPRLDAVDADPVDFQAALLDGFRAGYDAIVAHRAELVGPGGLLDRFAGDEIRVVVRVTRAYVTLLDESTHPDVLRDCLDREQVLDSLWADSPHDPLRPRLIRHELTDLWAGDVPLFRARAGGRDVATAAGDRLAGLLDESGLARVNRKIAGMDAVDRRAQEWLITAALATRNASPDHTGGAVLPGRVAPAVVDSQRLLAAACGVADQIVATAVHDGARANWLGLEAIEGRHWAVLPLGAGLADGYSGVALFLAQLGELTGVARYTDLAMLALPAVPRLIDALAAAPELSAAVGPGGLYGFGGICYALARIATLLGDAGVAASLPGAVELVGRNDNGQPGFAAGRAGGLAALLAVHVETGLAQAADRAGELAGKLADAEESGTVEVDRAGGPAGFADGPAGAGYALLRYATTGGERYAAAGRAALRRDRAGAGPPLNDGWCSGLAGAVLARSGCPETAETMAGLDRHVERLGAREPLRDISLCHGELGVIEALTVLAAHGNEAARAAQMRCAARVLGALDQQGPRCGTPGAVPSPGLLTGLAGIGYGMLRLGFPDRVPSVLLLEPGANIP